jgi:DNA-binding CsgD family transcriptional regulator
VLEALLSAAAAELYQRLLVTGAFPLDDPVRGSAPMRELIERGFAREDHTRTQGEPRIIPVEPYRAVENAVLTAQRRIAEEQAALIRVRDEIDPLQRAYRALLDAPADPHAGARVLTDPHEIGRVAGELQYEAKREVLNLETAHSRKPRSIENIKLPPADALERGVRFRNIYSRAVLELPHADELVRRSSAGGWELRVVDELPSKMVLVDDTALLPLDQTGMSGALLVTSPVVVSVLRTLFELLWARGAPVGESADRSAGKLTETQQRVLRLLLTGMTDGAIARHLGVSERTVRRHVSTLLDILGVDNRVAAAVVALREGWVA